jgi:hypothetical protein
MEFESVRPFLTGAAGGLFTLWLMKRWARFVPRTYQDKSAKQLVAEYRTSLIAANVLFFGTIALGIYIFKAGLAPSNSWKHLALVAGLAFLAPVAAVVLPVISKGKARIGEAVAAFAIAERTPVPVLGAIVLLGVICLASAIGALV